MTNNDYQRTWPDYCKDFWCSLTRGDPQVTISGPKMTGPDFSFLLSVTGHVNFFGSDDDTSLNYYLLLCYLSDSRDIPQWHHLILPHARGKQQHILVQYTM